MSKKKIMVAIEGEAPRYLTVDQINIMYNNIDNLDMAIVITPSQDSEPILGMPSSKGIEMNAKFSGPAVINDITEAKDKLADLRVSKGIHMLDSTTDFKLYKIVVPDRKIFTQYYKWNLLNGQKLALIELVALEKNLVGNLDNSIFVVGNEEFVFVEDGSKFKAQETVRVYERIVIPEDTTIVKTVEAIKDTANKPVMSTEDTELWDIFKELFSRNQAKLKAIISNINSKSDMDDATVEAINFFIGQAILATGNKIPRKKIESVMMDVVATLDDAVS